MSVLIKGMKMPKNCIECPLCLFANGYWKCLVDGSHADFGGTCRPSLCHLVSVQPHGRLIDADALPWDDPVHSVRLNGGEQWMSAYKIATAPTVIEAEVSE